MALKLLQNDCTASSGGSGALGNVNRADLPHSVDISISDSTLVEL